MTTYDSTVGARQNIAAGSDALRADVDATQDRLTGSRVKQALNRTKATATSATAQAGQTARKRPVVTSAAALAVAAVAATSVIGGRKIAEARRPRSRWERLMDRVPTQRLLSRFR
ncbi:hypothetical protein [Actinoplanes sp. GCM10030250]|uniref:hypothetical protein n=1 Tax=Actinoplanes sp. GCM10030250 TaxID=3273376 RepID=UPI00360FF64C